MTKYVHSYRCHCINWTENPIRVLSPDKDPQDDSLQHFQIRTGIGINPRCQGYPRFIKSEAVADSYVLEDLSAVPPRSPVLCNVTLDQIKGVVFGPKLEEHVLRGELNEGASTGYHSRCVEGEGSSRIPQDSFEVLTRPDGYGVYFAAFRIKQGSTLGTRKLSAMFPDRMCKEEILRSIRVAYVNTRQNTFQSIQWLGVCENGMRIGGRADGTGITSAFPAYRDSFDIPPHVA